MPSWTLFLLAAVTAWTGLTPSPAWAQKRQRDVITREELLASSQKNRDLLAAVRSLRSHFLAPPRGLRTSLGGGRPPVAALYVDGNHQGEIDGLKLIQTQDVEEVRYLDPSQAQNEFGITASGGTVLVKMFKAPRPSEPRPPV